jgi:hypothetical protein
MMKSLKLSTLFASLILAACVSEPYWQDPHWINSLGSAVHDSIYYPDSLMKGFVEHANLPHGEAVVQFDYENGKFDSVKIIKSTGSSVLDKVIADEIPEIKPPNVWSKLRANRHRFQMKISIWPYDNKFFKQISRDIAHNVEFVGSGLTIVKFEYKNSALLNPVVIKSSGSSRIDEAVIRDMRHTSLPQAPTWLGDKSLTLEVPVCMATSGETCPGIPFDIRYVIDHTTNTTQTNKSTR